MTAPTLLRSNMRRTVPRAKSNPPKASSAKQISDADRERAARLAGQEVAYIPTPEYDAVADDKLLELTQAFRPIPSPSPGEMPAYLARLCATELLTPEREHEAFALMNAAKGRAEFLRRRISLDRPDAKALDMIEALIEAGREIRETIVGANTRLVISIVKTLVTPRRRFDELLSDGLAILIHAVEKFDVERGYRFSTYAYRTICRNAFRIESKSLRDRKRFPNLDTEIDGSPARVDAATLRESEYDALTLTIRDLISNLDRREQFIVRGRFALGSHRRTKTFQELGNKLGISKERVRQLERRAMTKLQVLAANAELGELRAELPLLIQMKSASDAHAPPDTLR